MEEMRKLYPFALFLLLYVPIGAQNDSTSIYTQSDSIVKNNYRDNTFVPEEVIDEQYGIMMYEKLNMMLGGDTVRHDKNGYALNGYKVDRYTTGKKVHKGFYVDGQLKNYKNYYPNGNVERNYRLIDLKKSKMSIFYEEGSKKSEIIYVGSDALKWQDYYPDGTLEYIEEYDKSFQYYTLKASYFKNGKPRDMLELNNKKKLLYTQTYYHDNGKMKEQGEMKFNKTSYDYEKIGNWTLFDNTGKPVKFRKYANNQMVSEKDL